MCSSPSEVERRMERGEETSFISNYTNTCTMRYNIHVKLTSWSWEENEKGGRNTIHLQLHRHMYNEIQHSCATHLLKGVRISVIFSCTMRYNIHVQLTSWSCMRMNGKGRRNIQLHERLYNAIQHSCGTHPLKLREEWEIGKKHQSFPNTCTMKYSIHVQLTSWSWEGNGKGVGNTIYLQLHKHLYIEIHCKIELNIFVTWVSYVHRSMIRSP